MASSDPELKDGFTAAWMKKPAKEYESFAASPPPLEDAFYIRYPRTDVLFGKPVAENTVPKLLSEQVKEVAPAYNIVKEVKEKDWSKHTKPCQDVMHGIQPINTVVNSVTSKPKPAGTDDGFRGEGAACGTSIVKVAKNLMSTQSSRGFTVALPEDDTDVPDMGQYNLMHRRSSKSLPASPLHSPPGSPNSRRRFHANRYFTSPFEPTEDSSNRSWLTALLGFKKDLTTSTSTLAEEDVVDIRRGHLAESVENLGPAPRKKEPANCSSDGPGQVSMAAKASQAFRPKPSELREMNFWSPTSM